MVSKIIGIVLAVVGGALIVLLLTYGGPIFPHITGPIVLASIGVILLATKGKANKSTK